MSNANLIREIGGRVSSVLIEQKDAVITKAISDYLKRADWSPEEMRGRLVCATMPNKSEAYLLDGFELVRFELPEIAIDGGKMVGKLNYQILKE